MRRSTGDHSYASPKPNLGPLANETADGATVSRHNEKEEDATPLLAEADNKMYNRHVLPFIAEVGLYLSDVT